jgi:hypothetical protein
MIEIREEVDEGIRDNLRDEMIHGDNIRQQIRDEIWEDELDDLRKNVRENLLCEHTVTQEMSSLTDKRKVGLREHADVEVFRRFLAQAAGRSAFTKLDFMERERLTRMFKEMADAAVAHSERANREAAVLAIMAVAPAQSVTASARSMPTPGARATASSSAATTPRGVQKRRRRRRNQGWVRHSWAGWRRGLVLH